MTSAITPQVTHPPLPVAEHLIPRDNGYGVHEVAAVTLGEFTGRVCATSTATATAPGSNSTQRSDGVVDASSSGLGDNPQRLRQLASVAWATADELGEARARQRQAAGCEARHGATSPSPGWSAASSLQTANTGYTGRGTLNDRKRAWQILHTEIRLRATDEIDRDACSVKIGTIIRDMNSPGRSHHRTRGVRRYIRAHGGPQRGGRCRVRRIAGNRHASP